MPSLVPHTPDSDGFISIMGVAHMDVLRDDANEPVMAIILYRNARGVAITPGVAEAYREILDKLLSIAGDE